MASNFDHRGSENRVERKRLLVVATHPIQYQVPLYRHLAAARQVELSVIFLSDFGIRPSFDPGFNQRIAYDTDLLNGYSHDFLTTGRSEPLSRFSWPGNLIRAMFSADYDVVVVPGYATVAAWISCFVAECRSIPYMMRGETRLETELMHPRPRQLLKRLVLGPLLRRAGACLAIGASNRRFYSHYGVDESRIVLAPYSVDTEFFLEAGERGRSRRPAMLRHLGLDPALPTLLLAAKLQPHKRPLDSILALRQMKEPANLLVIGEGPLRAQMESAAQGLETVRHLGFVNQSEIGLWYGACDIVLLPSSREPWGLVVNEAMAAGAIPVVSSAVGCGPDLVPRGLGAIYPVGDVDALATTLDSLVADKASLASQRSRSQLLAREYSIEATARGFEKAVTIATTKR